MKFTGKVSSVAAPPPIVNSLHNRYLRFNRAVDTIHNRLSQENIVASSFLPTDVNQIFVNSKH